MHDCVRLLEHIRALPPDGGVLGPAEVGELGCYVTITDADRSVHYCVDPGVEGILSLFDRPRKLRDATALLQELAPDASINDGFFDELIDIGALIRTAADERAPSRAII